MELLHKDITDKIIDAYFNVYNDLGYGFLEKVYENALLVELNSMDLIFERQKQINVYYKSQNVGLYIADIIVDDSVIIELKAAGSLCEEHECQLLNYLKATDVEVGLLLNFGKKAEFKRKIFSNDKKKN